MTRFDRRKLLTSGAAAAVLLGTGVGAEARPKRGGLLRAVLSGGNTADGWASSGQIGAGPFLPVAAQGAVFETLTEIAPDGSLRGELLDRWLPQEGGARWQLHLRRDVRWHDGSQLRPSDVVASLDHHRRQGVPVARLIRSVRVRGDVLTLGLDTPRADMPYLLSDPRLIIAPGGNFATGIGSGLYRAEAFRPGEVFEGRRVVGHHRDGTAGWFDEVRLSAVDDRATQERLLRDRHADVGDLARIEGGGFTLHRVQGQPARPGFEPLRPFQGYRFTTHMRVAVPRILGAVWPMDNARIAERWWMA